MKFLKNMIAKGILREFFRVNTIKYPVISFLILYLAFSVSNANSNPGLYRYNSHYMQSDKLTYQAWVSLTVAEGKRLIAKGIVNYEPVRERLDRGYILVTKGTTNSYLVEEFIFDNLFSGEFVLGHILPEKSEIQLDRSRSRSELVLEHGVSRDVTMQDALDRMSEGDIVFKGANIINYSEGKAGVLIGSPTGGTTAVITPEIDQKNLRLIIPVGLEKDSSLDIDVLDEISRKKHQSVGSQMPYVWSISGELFTELEAIRQFANVETFHIASGGIGGAEGAVTISIRGEKQEVEKALEVIRSLQGEPPFLIDR